MPYAPGTRNKRNQPKRGRRRDDRLPASQRGYDRQWAELREWYARQHPLCEHCLARGKTVPLHEVDHVVPFDGPHDPLRLDAANLQSLCRSCHATKTAQDQAGA